MYMCLKWSSMKSFLQTKWDTGRKAFLKESPQGEMQLQIHLLKSSLILNYWQGSLVYSGLILSSTNHQINLYIIWKVKILFHGILGFLQKINSVTNFSSFRFSNNEAAEVTFNISKSKLEVARFSSELIYCTALSAGLCQLFDLL